MVEAIQKTTGQLQQAMMRRQTEGSALQVLQSVKESLDKITCHMLRLLPTVGSEELPAVSLETVTSMDEDLASKSTRNVHTNRNDTWGRSAKLGVTTACEGGKSLTPRRTLASGWGDSSRPTPRTSTIFSAESRMPRDTPIRSISICREDSDSDTDSPQPKYNSSVSSQHKNSDQNKDSPQPKYNITSRKSVDCSRPRSRSRSPHGRARVRTRKFGQARTCIRRYSSDSSQSHDNQHRYAETSCNKSTCSYVDKTSEGECITATAVHKDGYSSDSWSSSSDDEIYTLLLNKNLDDEDKFGRSRLDVCHTDDISDSGFSPFRDLSPYASPFRDLSPYESPVQNAHNDGPNSMQNERHLHHFNENSSSMKWSSDEELDHKDNRSWSIDKASTSYRGKSCSPPEINCITRKNTCAINKNKAVPPSLEATTSQVQSEIFWDKTSPSSNQCHEKHNNMKKYQTQNTSQKQAERTQKKTLVKTTEMEQSIKSVEVSSEKKKTCAMVSTTGKKSKLIVQLLNEIS